LKCDVVTNGTARYTGSSTIVVTMNQVPPSGSLNRSKYSFTEVFSLYGTPFFRR